MFYAISYIQDFGKGYATLEEAIAAGQKTALSNRGYGAAVTILKVAGTIGEPVPVELPFIPVSE